MAFWRLIFFCMWYLWYSNSANIARNRTCLIKLLLQCGMQTCLPLTTGPGMPHRQTLQWNGLTFCAKLRRGPKSKFLFLDVTVISSGFGYKSCQHTEVFLNPGTCISVLECMPAWYLKCMSLTRAQFPVFFFFSGIKTFLWPSDKEGSTYQRMVQDADEAGIGQDSLYLHCSHAIAGKLADTDELHVLFSFCRMWNHIH